MEIAEIGAFILSVKKAEDDASVDEITTEIVGVGDPHRQKERIAELVRLAGQCLRDRHVRPTADETLTPEQRWTRNQIAGAGEGADMVFAISTIGDHTGAAGKKVMMLFKSAQQYLDFSG